MDEHDDITNVPPLVFTPADSDTDYCDQLQHILTKWNSEQAAKHVARSIGYGWSIFRPARKEHFRFHFSCLNITIMTASIDYVTVQLELEGIPTRIDLRAAHERFINAIIKNMPNDDLAQSMARTLSTYSQEPPEWSTDEAGERPSHDQAPPSMGLAHLFLLDIYGDDMSTFDKDSEQKLIAQLCTRKYTQLTNALLAEFGGGLKHKKSETLPIDKT